MLDEIWVKEVDRRLQSLETRQAVDTASKEYMDAQFKELRDEVKGFKKEANDIIWKIAMMLLTPMVGGVVLWVFKGGMAATGAN